MTEPLRSTSFAFIKELEDFKGNQIGCSPHASFFLNKEIRPYPETEKGLTQFHRASEA